MYQHEYHSHNPSKVIYGLAGADRAYKALDNYIVYPEDDTMTFISNRIDFMVGNNPSIKFVYILDNRRGLKREYIESFCPGASIESCAIFKDTLEREGIRVYI